MSALNQTSGMVQESVNHFPIYFACVSGSAIVMLLYMMAGHLMKLAQSQSQSQSQSQPHQNAIRLQLSRQSEPVTLSCLADWNLLMSATSSRGLTGQYNLNLQITTWDALRDFENQDPGCTITATLIPNAVRAAQEKAMHRSRFWHDLICALMGAASCWMFMTVLVVDNQRITHLNEIKAVKQECAQTRWSNIDAILLVLLTANMMLYRRRIWNAILVVSSSWKRCKRNRQWI